ISPEQAPADSTSLSNPIPPTSPTGQGARILIVTDAWHPAVNGVIRTIESLNRELEAMGHQVLVIGTDRFRTLPLPSYPEIRLAWNAWRLPAMIDAFAPDSIH